MRNRPAISRLLVGSLVAVWLLSGCAATPKQVVSVAKQDLACPSAEVAKIGEDRYGASGCGRGAVYMRICDAGGCRWGRLRHGHEVGVAAQVAPAVPPPTDRQVLPAPAPETREVLPAPAPAPRVILPAPPPPGSAAPEASTPTQPGDAPAAAPGETPGAAPAPAPAPADSKTAPVPLSQGDLSAPYDATVPERPTVQQTSYAPPQPLVDDRPPPPAPSYVWVGGYWWWASTGWVWLPGYWCAPVVGYAYNPGYWYWSTGYWWYWPGGWARPGSTTIVVQTAPRTQRVVQVRSFTPRVVTARPVAQSPASARSVARATPSAGFRPQTSTLLRYPTPVRAAPVRSNSVRFAGNPGVGQVVRPGISAPRPSRVGTPRPGFSRPAVAPRTQFSRPPLRPGGRSTAPRIAPVTRMPSVGRSHRR